MCLQHMDVVHPDHAVFVGNAVSLVGKTMFVTQTPHDNTKVKDWVDRQPPINRFPTMMIERAQAPRHKFEVTDELRRLGVVGWLDEGKCVRQCLWSAEHYALTPVHPRTQ